VAQAQSGRRLGKIREEMKEARGARWGKIWVGMKSLKDRAGTAYSAALLIEDVVHVWCRASSACRREVAGLQFLASH
jgi:hypothetical protein